MTPSLSLASCRLSRVCRQRISHSCVHWEHSRRFATASTLDGNDIESSLSSAATESPIQPRKSTMMKIKRPARVTNPELFEKKTIITTIAEQLQAAGEVVASSSWIMIENIPPISSLHNMLAGIEDALISQQERRGILDLDAVWSASQQSDSNPPIIDIPQGDVRCVVDKALVVLSPFGRPTGWKIRLANRSLVHALLLQHVDDPIKCAWKEVRMREWQPDADDDASVSPQITNATLRVEGYPHHMSSLLLMNMFSRFDLDETRKRSIEPWLEKTDDFKSASATWLVHFADASWARAALREKQGTVIKGNALMLSPYPEQIV
ncbi:hypothetical protein MPSEU_000241800 [Mayamaea pseudoterrestris]|nr:hypothetical protein MPSEU_000241800 [Mayamaea pseudoterrestris]